jgi:hypothetical protein
MKTTEQLAATVRSIRNAARIAVLQDDRHAAQHIVDSAEAFERVAIAEIEKRDAVMQQMEVALQVANAYLAGMAARGSPRSGLEGVQGWSAAQSGTYAALKAYKELCDGN